MQNDEPFEDNCPTKQPWTRPVLTELDSGMPGIENFTGPIDDGFSSVS